MAPRLPAQRRNQQSSQNEHVYALGVRGRKTGVMLEDTGERDEYGMEPADALFSSPQKGANGHAQSASEDEQDMEIEDASSPGPATVSRLRGRLSIPKARSPLKTFLNSPARQNPHLARSSSPVRGSIIEENRLAETAQSAKRRLNFSQDPKMKQPTTLGFGKMKGPSQTYKPSQTNKVNGHVDEDESDDGPSVLRRRRVTPPVGSEEGEPMNILDMGEDDVQPPQDVYDQEEEQPQAPDVQEDEEEEVAPVEEVRPKKRGRKPKAPYVEEIAPEPEPEPEPEHVEGPEKKRRGRPPAKKAPAEEEEEEEAEPEPAQASKSPKRRRGRPSLNDQADESNEAETAVAAEERHSKRQKTETKAKAKPSKAEAKAPAAKGKPGRKRKSSGVGVDSPAVLPRPPLPKGRGLVTSRREELGVKTTRSGRVSTKPLEFWRGEHYDLDTEDEETLPDKGGRLIKIGTRIKGVVRVEYEEAEARPKKRRGRPASGGGGGGGGAAGRSRKRVSEVEEEEEREEWEEDPGRIAGECINWYPEYEFNPPQEEDEVEVAEAELAISQAAIQMKDIKDATFQFAKTLTLPFFGSGIVDLPPNSEKRTKNARKMQMVFFVHYGNVEVRVAQTTFRIGRGGMWFVPRGNHYSITNDTERPARLFFCQGCEVLVQAPESQDM